MPGALVDHAHEDAAAADARAHRHRLVVAVAQRVLDQVRERAPQLAGVGAQRAAGRARSRAAPGRARRCPRPRRGSTSSSEHQSSRGSAVPACSRARSSSWSTSRASRRLSCAIVSASSSRSSAPSDGDDERLAGGHDRRQRRAQVVRDRPQDGGLDLVAAPQRARLDDLGGQPLALERGPQQRLERGSDALARDLLGGGGHEQRAEPAERDGRVALVALDALEHDGGRVDPQRVGDPLGGRRQRRARLGRAEQQPRQLGGQVGLAPALLGLLGALASQLGQARGDRRQRRGRRPARPSSRRRRS